MARRRRIYARRVRRPGRNIARGMAAALIMAAVIYFAVAGGLGNRIAEHIIVPFMGGAAEGTPPASPTVGATATHQATATPDPTQAPEQHSEEILFASQPLYAIQLGAFVSEDNAHAEAQRYQKRGAAGYIFDYEERHRVLASVYLTRAEAENVQGQLLSQQGVESFVLALYEDVGEVALRVTAPAQGIAALREAVEGVRASLISLEGVSRKLDTGEVDATGAVQQIQSIVADLNRYGGILKDSSIEDDSNMLSSMGDIALKIGENFTNSSGTAVEAMEISSRIKYTYVESWIAYGQSLRSVARAGGG